MASWASVPWDRSGAANRLATTRPPGRVTRAASGSARARVAGELEGVDAGHRVEGGVGEREGLHVALAQVGVGQALAGDAEQAGADVQADGYRAAPLRPGRG